MQEHARELARESGYAPNERFVVTIKRAAIPVMTYSMPWKRDLKMRAQP